MLNPGTSGGQTTSNALSEPIRFARTQRRGSRSSCISHWYIGYTNCQTVNSVLIRVPYSSWDCRTRKDKIAATIFRHPMTKPPYASVPAGRGGRTEASRVGRRGQPHTCTRMDNRFALSMLPLCCSDVSGIRRALADPGAGPL